MTMQLETTSTRAEELVAWAAGFGPQLRANAAAHDEDGTWVSESYEALRAGYVLAFGTRSNPATVWFAPDLDTLYVPRWGRLGYADAARDFARHVLDTAEHVRRLAIDHVRPEVRRPWETYSKYWLMRGFPYLREAFLVLGAEDDVNRSGQIEFVDPRGSWAEIRAVMEAKQYLPPRTLEVWPRPPAGLLFQGEAS